MKEYRLGIHTNAWNACRYILITLVLLPLAEMLWARVHSKRTGARLRRGYTARLAQSKLAYWGLHQEIDENSRVSRVLVIAIFVLHVAGTLLLEYGSGSEKTYDLRDAVVSRTFRDDGQLRANVVYFFDAGYIFGKPYGSTECVDGGPRSLSDFGLVARVIPRLKVLSNREIRIPQGTVHQKAEYGLRSSVRLFQMYEEGSARWYGYNNKTSWNAPSDHITVFVNETVSCWIRFNGFFECTENNGKIEHAQLLSDALAL